MTNSEEAFEAITRSDLRLPRVDTGRMFGSTGLKVRGKVYAMLVKGQLVVKIPAERVEKLTSEGVAKPFDPGHGRVMKEWAAVSADQASRWRRLATEARRFVESGA